MVVKLLLRAIFQLNLMLLAMDVERVMRLLFDLSETRIIKLGVELTFS